MHNTRHQAWSLFPGDIKSVECNALYVLDIATDLNDLKCVRDPDEMVFIHPS